MSVYSHMLKYDNGTGLYLFASFCTFCIRTKERLSSGYDSLRPHSPKTQPVVSGSAAEGPSDAEGLIVSHKAQRGVEAQQHMLQPWDIREQCCHFDMRSDGVSGALGLFWQFKIVWDYKGQLVVIMSQGATV